jgi:hypothetical protein
MSIIAAAVLVLAGSAPALPELTAKEMAQAVIALDKALGLESWGDKPCVDRGAKSGPARDVSVEETRKCAASAVASGFPELGKTYVLAVLMAPVGPLTVMAVGKGGADGWAAASCDPGKKCPAMRMDPTNRWGRRLVERLGRACADGKTVWLPANGRACPDASTREDKRR